MAAETDSAESAKVPVKFIFVEPVGSAQASAAVEAAMSVIESHIVGHSGMDANHAPSTAPQAELEFGIKEGNA